MVKKKQGWRTTPSIPDQHTTFLDIFFSRVPPCPQTKNKNKGKALRIWTSSLITSLPSGGHPIRHRIQPASFQVRREATIPLTELSFCPQTKNAQLLSVLVSPVRFGEIPKTSKDTQKMSANRFPNLNCIHAYFPIFLLISMYWIYFSLSRTFFLMTPPNRLT